MNEINFQSIGLLARPAGLMCLKHLLIHKELYTLKAIFTHRYLPKSESNALTERAEFTEFKSIAELHKIPLMSVDEPADQNKIEALCEEGAVDLLISCSWRYRVSQNILNSIKFGGINLHRGDLPAYKGAEPIKRALNDGCKQGGITAHQMIEEIDAGKILYKELFPIEIRMNEDVDAAVTRIKESILPLYPIVLNQAVNHLTELSNEFKK